MPPKTEISYPKLESTTLPQAFTGHFELKKLKTESGSLTYKLFDGDPEKPAILLVAGFPLGTTQLDNFAAELNMLGDRRIIEVNRARPKGLKKPTKSTLAKEATLMLAMLKREGFADEDIQTVAHSSGGILFQELAEQAGAEGLNCFKGENSKLILLDPTGTFNDNIFKLAWRFGKFAVKGMPSAKVFDPKMRLLKENIGVIVPSPYKSAGEIRAIARKRLDAQRLGQTASRPELMYYPEDPLFGYEVKGTKKWLADAQTPMEITHENLPSGAILTRIKFPKAYIGGVSTPVGPSKFLGMAEETFKQKAKEGAADPDAYYRAAHTARHDALIMNPEATARAVLQQFDGPVIEHIRRSEQEYLAKQAA